MEQPNLNYIKEISGGDKQFEKKLLDIVKEELPLEIEAYYEVCKIVNHKEIIASVHKLKHKISILGLEKDYELASNFEEALKLSDLKLQASFESILDKMVTFLKQH